MAQAIVPSKYQKRIYKEFESTNNNIFIQAVAGSGKSTTLVELIKLIPSAKDAIFIAFNRHIADHLKEKIPPRHNITVSTINSFGARMLYRALGNIALVENKYMLIALRLFKNKWALGKENKWSYCYNISKIVDLMRFNFCYDDDELLYQACLEYDITIMRDELQHAREVFEIGINDLNKIDFIDQIFLPVIRNIKFKKFDFVMADEVQDFSKLQHQFIRKLLKPVTGRLIAVGDRYQSIYFFAGASSNSFDLLRDMLPNTVELPLSICYRCALKVVEAAKVLVPQIEARPGADAGSITACHSAKFIKEQDVVLCRFTKPLVLLCRDLIRQGKKAVIKGREIGENIIILIKKTRASTIEQCVRCIEGYEVELRGKLLKKGVYRPEQHKQMLQLVEKKEIIKILGTMVFTLPALIKKVEQIFIGDDEKAKGILLMTIHRSKGLEFDRVWFLNRFLLPSPYATTKEELQQESNLEYVAITRSKHHLIYINIYGDEEVEI